ncbi:NAD(P)H-hydrate dehydratase [Candidatus Izimaplasma bacterium]|nr:NAD(P)H-hydrate dehydratase [Candidatus Izimaplasma bacterium]
MKERQIVTAYEMKQLDNLTIDKKNISSLELMIRAGKLMSKHICQFGLCGSTERVLLVAGVGNNGGDALVIASEMISNGFVPNILLVGPESKQTKESLTIWNKLKDLLLGHYRIDDIKDVNKYNILFNEASIIIDGLFGTGLTKEVKGYHREIIERINNSYAKVISLDIPSGLNADNGLVSGIAVKASDTLVVQNFKTGNFLNDAVDYTGKLHLLDIGILQLDFPTRTNLLQVNYLRKKIPERIQNTHKYHYGNILTIGGSKGMMGAPILSGYAALRTGSGLSHVIYNEKYLHHIQNPYPTLMIDTYEDIKEISIDKISTVIFGPGLGKKDDINKTILKRLIEHKIPLIVDADGVLYLKEILLTDKAHPSIVVTPHYGEMAQLLDLTSKEIELDPIKYAKEISLKYGITVVLKGVTTIITNYEETYLSNNGNPGMATAGSGDVLCGVIGSLLGRGFSSLEASKLGVLIHSQAANIAAKELGQESLVASDIIHYIPLVLKG